VFLGRVRRLASVFGLVTVVVVVTAVSAAAHVTVEPATAAKGIVADLVFRSPNERSTAIVTFEVTMPDGVTTFVPASPPGWTAAIVDRTVRWTGGRIAAGTSASFGLRLGPLPSTDSVGFPVVQTYDDGVSVRWDEAPTSTGHPAPSLALTGVAPPTTTTTIADPGAAGHGHDTTVETAGKTIIATPTTDKTNSVTGVIGIALAGIGLAFVLGWAVFVGTRTRERNRRLLDERTDE
jgi:periplasmic copper chaperone A